MKDREKFHGKKQRKGKRKKINLKIQNRMTERQTIGKHAKIVKKFKQRKIEEEDDREKKHEIQERRKVKKKEKQTTTKQNDTKN